MDNLPLHLLIEALNEAEKLNLSADFINLIKDSIDRKNIPISGSV
ncbi:sporulation histidine kinase inhibitor Sda [Jeotgalibacillus marinus]|uniref:Sporulation histidine kinase inhibitor Sda n=1 Tax=Jeotgalibacillus marinus TaxID=86667 RepID=A0ABV3PZK2_9BACL